MWMVCVRTDSHLGWKMHDCDNQTALYARVYAKAYPWCSLEQRVTDMLGNGQTTQFHFSQNVSSAGCDYVIHSPLREILRLLQKIRKVCLPLLLPLCLCSNIKFLLSSPALWSLSLCQNRCLLWGPSCAWRSAHASGLSRLCLQEALLPPQVWVH